MSKLKRQPSILVLLCALALVTFACRKASTENAATETSTTATSASDTSGTTSTIDTSGTETTGTTSTTSTGSSGGTISSLDTTDKEFVMKAAQGGMAEVMLGQMASSKGTSPDVKNFGNRMVSDHGKANDELKQLAQNKGVALPAGVDKESKQFADRLSKASGKDFDKEYINNMVNDHEKDVNEFEKASKNAKDPDLRAWAAKTLPTLQDHLKMAKEVKSKLK
jgi:putative membrane protein